MKRKYLLFYAVITSFILWGQTPVIKTPQSAKMLIVPIYTNPNKNIPTAPNFPNYPTQNTKNPLDIYEQDRMEVERRKNEPNKSIHEYYSTTQDIQYDFPSQSDEKGTESYRKSAKLLNDMLNGVTPINIKNAVYAVENAYFDGKLEYNKYSKAIQELITTAKTKSMQDGYDWNNPFTRNIMLFRVMTDTLKIKLPTKETSITSQPLKYDFEDFMGKEDWTKMFVSKLLATKTGQCHSMPLLYLIMCEATNTSANIAYSPMHSYIKLKSPNNEWYNLELTNGHIVSDAYMVGSGFISSEALKNKIYMEPQTRKQIIQECLADLVNGYISKYGYDKFVEQNIHNILKQDPKFLQALQIKSNYQTARFYYVAYQLGKPPIDTIKVHFPRAYKLFEERNATYKYIDNIGYKDMPADAYQDWLKTMENENKKQQQEKLIHRIQIIR